MWAKSLFEYIDVGEPGAVYMFIGMLAPLVIVSRRSMTKVVGHIQWALEMHKHVDPICPFLKSLCLSHMMPVHCVVWAFTKINSLMLLFLNPAKNTSSGNSTSGILKLA
jgi:hypothetical protein